MQTINIRIYFLSHCGSLGTREKLSHNEYLENLSFCTNNYLDISSKTPQCEKLHKNRVKNSRATRIVLSLQCIFSPISVCFAVIWTSEKFDFIVTQIFGSPEYPFGVHLFPQMFPLNAPRAYHPRVDEN